MACYECTVDSGFHTYIEAYTLVVMYKQKYFRWLLYLTHSGARSQKCQFGFWKLSFFTMLAIYTYKGYNAHYCSNDSYNDWLQRVKIARLYLENSLSSGGRTNCHFRSPPPVTRVWDLIMTSGIFMVRIWG